jgi:O-antigen/teichoic acid export membrane protein
MSSEGGRGMGLLQASTITFASRVAVFILSLVAGVILARALGPTGRGIYALALLVPSVLVLLANLGVGNALIYYLARRTYDVEKMIGQLISLALLLGVAATIVLVAFTALFGRVALPGVPLNLVLIAGAAIPLGLFFYFCLSFTQGMQAFVAFNSLYLVNAGALVVFLLGLLVVPGSVTVAVVAWSLSWVPTALLGMFWLSRYGRLNIRFDRGLSRSLLRFGIVGYLAFITNYLNFRLDTFLVNIFKNATQVGYYAVAVSLAETIWYVSTSAATVLAPRVAAGETQESDDTTARVSRTVFVVSLAAAVLLGLTAPLIIRILFGAGFAPSVAAVWLLLPGVVTLSVARVLSSYLLGRNRQQVDLVASLAGLVVTLALDLLLIPRYGFPGAAAASSVAYTATLAVNLTGVIRNSTLSARDLLVPRLSDFLSVLSLWPRSARPR